MCLLSFESYVRIGYPPGRREVGVVLGATPRHNTGRREAVYIDLALLLLPVAITCCCRERATGQLP